MRGVALIQPWAWTVHAGFCRTFHTVRPLVAGELAAAALETRVAIYARAQLDADALIEVERMAGYSPTDAEAIATQAHYVATGRVIGTQNAAGHWIGARPDDDDLRWMSIYPRNTYVTILADVVGLSHPVDGSFPSPAAEHALVDLDTATVARIGEWEAGARYEVEQLVHVWTTDQQPKPLQAAARSLSPAEIDAFQRAIAERARFLLNKLAAGRWPFHLQHLPEWEHHHWTAPAMARAKGTHDDGK